MQKPLNPQACLRLTNSRNLGLSFDHYLFNFLLIHPIVELPCPKLPLLVSVYDLFCFLAGKFLATWQVFFSKIACSWLLWNIKIHNLIFKRYNFVMEFFYGWNLTTPNSQYVLFCVSLTFVRMNEGYMLVTNRNSFPNVFWILFQYITKFLSARAEIKL